MAKKTAKRTVKKAAKGGQKDPMPKAQVDYRDVKESLRQMLVHLDSLPGAKGQGALTKLGRDRAAIKGLISELKCPQVMLITYP